MPSDKFLISARAIEPLTVTIEQAADVTGESRSKVYERIGLGEYDAVKSGRRTLVIYDSIKRRVAKLPRATIKAPPARRHPRAATKAEIPE